MSEQHTPGPWEVAPNGVCVFAANLRTGAGIAHCGMAARTREEVAANARLIAAAPCMLAALKDISACLDAEAEGGLTDPEALENIIQGAIEKAQGGAR